MTGLFFIASLASLVVACQGAVPAAPAWHTPCGQPLEPPPPAAPGGGERRVSWDRQLARGLAKISRRLDLALDSFEHQGFDERYQQFGITDEQLTASWLPGEGDANVLVETYKQNKQVPLKNLHADLQLFSSAFEQMIQEEPDTENKLALVETETCNLELLCEVETALVSLEMGVPARQGARGAQGAGPEPAAGVAAGAARHWAALRRYRHYLRGWARLLRRQRRQRQQAEPAAR